MIIELAPGETLKIGIKDSEAEVITVVFKNNEFFVDADLPDSDGRVGRIYEFQIVPRMGELVKFRKETKVNVRKSHTMEESG